MLERKEIRRQARYSLKRHYWIFVAAYLLSPYLAAENPDLSPMEVIRLSNRMMKGHKWEAFRLELSILPWMLLSVVTGGLAGILFFNPYREAVLAEYYAQVRRVSLENRIEGTEKLNDRYLFEIPPAAVLNDAYADIAKLSKAPRKKMSVRKGFWAFLEKYFGIVPAYDKIEKEYRAQMLVNQQIEEYGDALNGKTYPARLFPIPEIQRRKKTGDVGYTRHYSLTSVILLFFTGCMVGWTWEVGLHLLQAGEFVNRGVLHGPWLPIYGGGATLILLLLYRFRKNALLEFLLIIALCGVVEYFTSWILEVIHDGQRWWDYSGYYLNLNGRICAEGLLVFGIGGVAFVYVIAPLFDELIEQIKGAVLWPVCIFLLAAFAVDVVYSSFVPNTGKGISTASVSSESPSTRIV